MEKVNSIFIIVYNVRFKNKFKLNVNENRFKFIIDIRTSLILTITNLNH